MLSKFGLRDKQHEAEAAWIVVCDDGAMLHVKHDMVVLWVRGGRIGKVSQHLALRPLLLRLA